MVFYKTVYIFMKQSEEDEGTVFHIFKTSVLNNPFFESCALLENKIDYFYDKNNI